MTLTDTAFAIEFYERLTQRNPDHVGALSLLGEYYTKAGRYADGLAIDRRLTDLTPENPTVWYNLACSLSRMRQFDAALAALHAAVQLGYSDFPYMQRDPDLAALRETGAYQQFIWQVVN